MEDGAAKLKEEPATVFSIVHYNGLVSFLIAFHVRNN
jgi:hypothetical protein